MKGAKVKKNAVKEFIITSVAAAVAGFVVKQGYEFFQDQADASKKEKKNSPKSLPASEGIQEASSKVVAAYNESSTPQKGIIATLAYTVTAYMVTKVLRKII